MDEKKKDNENEKENVTIRHTINAEETFTLAKDVFDLRCFIKNIYQNRAVIARRLNIFSLVSSLMFTVLYVAYILFSGLLGKLELSGEIALYSLLGGYAVVVIVLVSVTLFASSNAKNFKRLQTTLKVFRFCARVLSLVIAVLAFVIASSDGYSASQFAVNILMIFFSVVAAIIQLIPLLFGGIAKLVRWLLSPVKFKHKFSLVALEWYELAVSSSGDKKSIKKISDKYYEDIGRVLDSCLIPALGKKYVSQIKTINLLNAVESVPEEDRHIAEGVLKSVFEYATECGYVTFNPCADLNFEGTIEEEEKPKSTIKTKLFNFGKRVGAKALDKFINSNTDSDKTKK
jgi:hypothetical protein